MSSPSILLLEDNKEIGAAYAAQLLKAGSYVAWATKTQQMKDFLETIIPDIVLLDHCIEGEEVTGCDLIPYIKKKAPKAKIIMLSSLNDPELKKQWLTAGADEYLLKSDQNPKDLSNYLLQLL